MQGTLIIEIGLTDIEEEALDEFLREAKNATSIKVEVGRLMPKKEWVVRMTSISSEYFKAKRSNP